MWLLQEERFEVHSRSPCGGPPISFLLHSRTVRERFCARSWLRLTAESVLLDMNFRPLRLAHSATPIILIRPDNCCSLSFRVNSCVQCVLSGKKCDLPLRTKIPVCTCSWLLNPADRAHEERHAFLVRLSAQQACVPRNQQWSKNHRMTLATKLRSHELKFAHVSTGRLGLCWGPPPAPIFALWLRITVLITDRRKRKRRSSSAPTFSSAWRRCLDVRAQTFTDRMGLGSYLRSRSGSSASALLASARATRRARPSRRCETSLTATRSCRRLCRPRSCRPRF